jgi:hypothetical protein
MLRRLNQFRVAGHLPQRIESDSRMRPKAFLSASNAAPEWQARTLERKQEIGGGLSTRGAC